MSNLPPSDLPSDTYLAYASAPQRNTIALWSMILGIVGMPLSCVLVGLPLGLAALVLGIISLAAIDKNPLLGRKGMALTGVVTGVCCIIVLPLIVLLTSPFGRPKELANRSACAANLAGIVKAANLYGAGNDDQYPGVLGPRVAQTYTSPSSTGGPSGVPGSAGNAGVAIAGYYNASTFSAGDPMVCMWILVLNGNLSPKQFICKSDPASPTRSDMTDTTGRYYYAFGETDGASVHEAYSYSIAYPWRGVGGPSAGTPFGAFWRATMDSSVPIAANMAPLNNSGSPLKNVTTSKGGLGASRVYNSNNHSGGDGQNVVFADSHVEFCTSPYVGQSGDNIWTTGEAGSQAAIATQGTIPAPPSDTSPYDLIFVPVRSASTNLQ